jgi:hypothetical protein
MFRSSENKELTFVSKCFQNKKKEEIGHYGQTLIRIAYPMKSKLRITIISVSLRA